MLSFLFSYVTNRFVFLPTLELNTVIDEFMSTNKHALSLCSLDSTIMHQKPIYVFETISFALFFCVLYNRPSCDIDF